MPTSMFKVRKEDTAKKTEYFIGNEEFRPEFLYGDRGHSIPPNVVWFSPWGTYLASGGADQTILIWDYWERY